MDAKPGKTKTETYENEVKRLFIKEPWNMKLLIVVDKLLTGFDAELFLSTLIKRCKIMGFSRLFAAPTGWMVKIKIMGTSLIIKICSQRLRTLSQFTKSLTMRKDRLAQRLRSIQVRTCPKPIRHNVEAVEELCEPVEPPKETLNYIDISVAIPMWRGLEATGKSVRPCTS